MAKGKYHDWISDEGLQKISKWAESGLTDQQISNNMGISVSTLNEWKRKFPQLMESLKKSKAAADQEVENALFKSACGYYVEEQTTEKSWNSKTNRYDVTAERHIRKWVQPNVTAQIFWLKNRQPDQWRDKVVQENVNEDRDIHITFLPQQKPVPPPPEVTDRDAIIKYYESEFITEEEMESYGD